MKLRAIRVKTPKLRQFLAARAEAPPWCADLADPTNPDLASGFDHLKGVAETPFNNLDRR